MKETILYSSAPEDLQLLPFETQIENILEEVRTHETLYVNKILLNHATEHLRKDFLEEKIPQEIINHEKSKIKRRLRECEQLKIEGTRNKLNHYKSIIQNHSTLTELISDINHTLNSEVKKDTRIKCAIEMTYIYTALAQLKSEESDKELAWMALLKASYYRGLFTGLDDPNTYGLAKRASSGGMGRSLKIAKDRKDKESAKNRVIEIMKENKPHNGWRSFFHAAEAVLEPVLNAIKHESLALTTNEVELKAYLVNIAKANQSSFIIDH